jgi:hypothetical protein
MSKKGGSLLELLLLCALPQLVCTGNTNPRVGLVGTQAHCNIRTVRLGSDVDDIDELSVRLCLVDSVGKHPSVRLGTADRVLLFGPWTWIVTCAGATCCISRAAADSWRCARAGFGWCRLVRKTLNANFLHLCVRAATHRRHRCSMTDMRTFIFVDPCSWA